MKKVLILGVAAVQMDAIAQLNRMGCETWAAAMAMDGPGARIARHFDQINILDEPKLQAHILRHQIDAVYSTGSDLAMPVACRLSEKLGVPVQSHPMGRYAGALGAALIARGGKKAKA